MKQFYTHRLLSSVSSRFWDSSDPRAESMDSFFWFLFCKLLSFWDDSTVESRNSSSEFCKSSRFSFNLLIFVNQWIKGCNERWIRGYTKLTTDMQSSLLQLFRIVLFQIRAQFQSLTLFLFVIIRRRLPDVIICHSLLSSHLFDTYVYLSLAQFFHSLFTLIIKLQLNIFL